MKPDRIFGSVRHDLHHLQVPNIFNHQSSVIWLGIGIALASLMCLGITPSVHASEREIRREILEGAREVRQERREAARELLEADDRDEARQVIREGIREVRQERREMRREIRREIWEERLEEDFEDLFD